MGHDVFCFLFLLIAVVIRTWTLNPNLVLWSILQPALMDYANPESRGVCQTKCCSLWRIWTCGASAVTNQDPVWRTAQGLPRAKRIQHGYLSWRRRLLPTLIPMHHGPQNIFFPICLLVRCMLTLLKAPKIAYERKSLGVRSRQLTLQGSNFNFRWAYPLIIAGAWFHPGKDQLSVFGGCIQATRGWLRALDEVIR